MLKTRQKQPEKDPFLCTCGPCKSFWRTNFDGPGELLYRTAIARAANTSVILEATLNREDHPAILRLGDRVVVHGQHKGTVRFVGVLQENTIAPETFVGVHLDENIGSPHNGVYNGKRYFHCPRGHGAMVRFSDVMRCNPPEKRPPIKGNYMFPSFNEVQTRRRVREEKTQPTRSDLPGLNRSHTETQDKRLLKREPRKFVFDKEDIAVKDALRREQEERQRLQRALVTQQRQEEAAMATNMQQWRERFSANAQADRMANALRKLHSAYVRGVAWKRRQERGEQSDSDADDDDDDDDDDEEPEVDSRK